MANDRGLKWMAVLQQYQKGNGRVTSVDSMCVCVSAKPRVGEPMMTTEEPKKKNQRKKERKERPVKLLLV
jgi:hypothetical protein